MKRPTIRKRIVAIAAVVLSALPSAASAQAGFAAQVSQPQSQTYGYVAQWLRTSQFLDVTARGMNEAFNLPQRAWIVGAECGQENAFWQPERRTVVICYELLHSIFEEFRYDGLTQEQFGTAVASAATFVLFHEIGHGLIDLLDLAVTGRAEDVVDQFATLALAENNGIAAYWAAQYWRQRNDFGDMGIFKFDSTPFSDEHGFDEQRFYNILCWTYGRSPNDRGYLLEVLPQARAVRCPGEYQQMARAWEGLLAPHVRSGGGSNGRVNSRPQPSSGGVIQRRESNGGVIRPTNRLGGRWRYEETIGNSSSPMYCVNNGTYDFDVAGQSLSGRFQQVGSCVVSGQRLDNPGSGSISQGNTQGDQIYFVVDNCTYQGRVDRRDPDQITGELACAVEVGNGTQQVVGSWRATRF